MAEVTDDGISQALVSSIQTTMEITQWVQSDAELSMQAVDDKKQIVVALDKWDVKSVNDLKHIEEKDRLGS